MTPLTLSILVFGAVVFVCLAILVFVTSGMGGEKKQLKERLEQVATDTPLLTPEGLREEQSPIDEFLRKAPGGRRMELLLEQSDLRMRLGQFVLLSILLGLIGLVGGYLLSESLGKTVEAQKALLGVIAALVLGGIPFLIAADRRRSRIRRFTEQFPDALSMISRSVRAGHGFSVAMQLVGSEMPEPIAQFFRRASEEQRFGLGLDEVLGNIARRMPTLDVQFFASAVIIQRETGGNLAEIMDKLGEVIRERFRIMGEIRVFTAQGRLTGLVLGALPLVVGLLIFLVRSEYVMVLFQDRLGLMMVGAALGLQAVGFLVIRSIIHIKI
jgi:tight adherence protein B